MKYNITNTETVEDNAEIGDVFGQGCHSPTGQGVSGFQVDFELVVTREDGEAKTFNVVFQNSDSNDNLKAYTGFEMETAASLGCDADESAEIHDFLDSSDYTSYSEAGQKLIEELCEKAEELCEKWFDENYNAEEYSDRSQYIVRYTCFHDDKPGYSIVYAKNEDDARSEFFWEAGNNADITSVDKL